MKGFILISFFFFSSKIFGFDDLIKNDKRCAKFKSRHNSLLESEEKYGYLKNLKFTDLRIDTLMEKCFFNNSKTCWHDAHLASEAERKLNRDYWHSTSAALFVQIQS